MAQSLEPGASPVQEAHGPGVSPAQTQPAPGHPWRVTRAAPRRPASEVPWITGIRLSPGGEGRLINISSVGCLVGSETRLMPGTEVVIRFGGSIGQQPQRAAVVRSEVASIDRSGKVSYRSGIAFAGNIDLGMPESPTAEVGGIAVVTGPALAQLEPVDQVRRPSRSGISGADDAAAEVAAREREALEARCQLAEARCRELADRHAGDRSEWETTLRGAEERLGRLATEQAEERAALERRLSEAQTEHDRWTEQYAADQVGWEQSLSAAEDRCQALIEERQAVEREWQQKVSELVEERQTREREWQEKVSALVTQRQTSEHEWQQKVSELTGQLRESETRFEHIREEHAAARVECERTLQAAEARHEAAAAAAQAECDRLDVALDDMRARYRELHGQLTAVLRDASPADEPSDVAAGLSRPATSA